MPNNLSTARNLPAEDAILTPSIEIVASNADPCRYRLSEKQLSELQGCLKMISTDAFSDPAWNVQFLGVKQKEIRFPQNLPEEDDQLLRATVLDCLLELASIPMAKRIVSNAKVIFSFLESCKLHIENTRSSTVNLFIDYLNNTSYSDEQKDSLIRTYGRLFTTCALHGFTDAPRTVDFSYRFSQKGSEPKRAPDQCVVDAITRIIFDVAYPVPTAYRTILMLLRLIPNRISEVLSMDVDCIAYPSEDLFSVAIATRKEEDLHTPKVERYSFLASGLVENLLYITLKEQQEIVSRSQTTSGNADYLFYDPSKGRLITADDVNKFLDALIVKKHITDSLGNPAKVTTHDFRHVAIGEMLRDNVVPPYRTMVLANHSNIEETLSYGYQSVQDEAKRLDGIMADIYKDTWTPGDDESCPAKPQEIPSKRYARLEEQPFTRIIPAYGICTNQSCTPQFERCVDCESYRPDYHFLEYFEAAKEHLEKKIALLQQKHGSQAAIDFNMDRLKTYNKFIDRITQKSAQERKNA